MVIKASTVASAFVFREPWQAERGFHYHHLQASDKSPPRPVYAFRRPFAGGWLRQSLCGPPRSSRLSSHPPGFLHRRLARALGAPSIYLARSDGFASSGCSGPNSPAHRCSGAFSTRGGLLATSQTPPRARASCLSEKGSCVLQVQLKFV